MNEYSNDFICNPSLGRQGKISTPMTDLNKVDGLYSFPFSNKFYITSLDKVLE